MNYYRKLHRETVVLAKAETEYKANADGTRIANIPFEKYIRETDEPENAVIFEIDGSYSGELKARRLTRRLRNYRMTVLSASHTVNIKSQPFYVSTEEQLYSFG